MIVLIDDDKLMHMSWTLKAINAGKLLTTYYSVEEFLESNTAPSENLIIYIDSSLSKVSRGEIEAKKLTLLGYNNIYLSTGYLDLKQENYPWLKGIISKTPPF